MCFSLVVVVVVAVAVVALRFTFLYRWLISFTALNSFVLIFGILHVTFVIRNKFFFFFEIFHFTFIVGGALVFVKRPAAFKNIGCRCLDAHISLFSGWQDKNRLLIPKIKDTNTTRINLIALFMWPHHLTLWFGRSVDSFGWAGTKDKSAGLIWFFRKISDGSSFDRLMPWHLQEDKY